MRAVRSAALTAALFTAVAALTVPASPALADETRDKHW